MSNKELPYFPLYASDQHAATSHLTLEEDGAYNRLLRLCWMTAGCSLPDDNEWIRRRLGVDQDTFERVVQVVILEFFERKKGRVFNANLMLEFEKITQTRKSKSEGGKKGQANKRLKIIEKHPNIVKTDLQHPEPEPEPELDIDKSISCLFSDFWNVWPNKVSKKSAEKAWSKLALPDQQVVIAAVPAWFENWRRQNPQASPIHAATFLNGKRWKDAPLQLTRISGGRNDSASKNHGLQRIVAAAATGTSGKDWG